MACTDAHAHLQLRSDERHQHSLAAAMKPLLTYAEGTTTVATAATPSSSSEPECPSPSSMAFSEAGAGANKDQIDSGSGRSSPSASSSSSSAADAFSFSASGQRSPSTSTSVLCFGAGGAGVRLWSSSKALARASKLHGEEEDAQAAAVNVAPPKGFAMGRHLRRISRRLRKARAANKGTAAAPRRGAVDDDDMARERAEAVASAIAHCKETLRRGAPWRRRRRPPALSSLSLDLWLHDRQDEIIASAGDARRPTSATTLARHAAPCMRLPLPHIAPPAVAAATGTPPSQISGVTSRETETRGGFSELEFLETFDRDDELIDRHFITVQI